MTQQEFLEDNFQYFATKFLNKVDRCGVFYWDLFSPAQKQIAQNRRRCYNCVFKRKEDDFCTAAGKELSDLPMLRVW